MRDEQKESIWAAIESRLEQDRREAARREAEKDRMLDFLTGQTCPCCNGKGRIRIVGGTRDDA